MTNMKTGPRPRYHITSSDQRKSLVFVTKEEKQAFDRDESEVIAKHRAVIREKYGIWAGNQDKFVATEAELNRFDSRDYV